MKDDGEKCFFFNDEILVDKKDDDDIDGSDGFWALYARCVHLVVGLIVTGTRNHETTWHPRHFFIFHYHHEIHCRMGLTKREFCWFVEIPRRIEKPGTIQTDRDGNNDKKEGRQIESVVVGVSLLMNFWKPNLIHPWIEIHSLCRRRRRHLHGRGCMGLSGKRSGVTIIQKRRGLSVYSCSRSWLWYRFTR